MTTREGQVGRKSSGDSGSAEAQKTGVYSEVVVRLQAIVEALERGELSLEESLDRFAEGMALVKRGEGLLAEAEKRVEQLLSEDGRTAPLKLAEAPVTRAAPDSTKAAPRREPDDDIPF